MHLPYHNICRWDRFCTSGFMAYPGSTQRLFFQGRFGALVVHLPYHIFGVGIFFSVQQACCIYGALTRTNLPAASNLKLSVRSPGRTDRYGYRQVKSTCLLSMLLYSAYTMHSAHLDKCCSIARRLAPLHVPRLARSGFFASFRRANGSPTYGCIRAFKVYGVLP